VLGVVYATNDSFFLRYHDSFRESYVKAPSEVIPARYDLDLLSVGGIPVTKARRVGKPVSKC